MHRPATGKAITICRKKRRAGGETYEREKGDEEDDNREIGSTAKDTEDNL